MKFLSMAVIAASMMALASCGGNAKTDAAAADTTATEPAATEQTQAAQPEATAQNLGEAEEGVIMYKGNEKIQPAATPIIIDFNAPWCGPCHKFVPTFHKIAQEFEGKATFMEVDIDANPVTRDQFVEENKIPQVTILMPDGTMQTKKGLMKEDEFRAMVQSVLK